MTANEAILDRNIRHAIYLQRFGGGLVARFIGLLNRTDADLVDLLQKRLAKLLDRGFDTGPATTKRLNDVLDEVRALNVDAYKVAGRELTDQLKAFAEYERNWHVETLKTELPVALTVTTPALPLVQAAVLKRPFQGRLLSEWLDGVEAAKAARIRDSIRIGLVEGQTIDQMVRSIRGTRASGYQDGLLEIDRRGAQALVRTAVNHTSNAARDIVFQENDDLIKGVKWVATLDARTTPICQARDGKVFPLTSGPRPPAHIGCRSTVTPVLKSWKELGLNLGDAPEGTRASLDGQVPGDLTYGEWLKKQPAAFQDEVLGPARGKLLRQGGLTVDRFVDRAGHEITLDELRKLQPEAFARAGL